MSLSLGGMMRSSRIRGSAVFALLACASMTSLVCGSEWSEWGECTQSCGYGVQLQHRPCPYGSQAECRVNELGRLRRCKDQECPTPENIGARLINGSRASEGRVEVYHEGQWGTVCDNLFRIQEAGVVCKQLGYMGADQVDISGQFGEGQGDVFLDRVQCTGEEENLFECLHSGIQSTTCNHEEDVGVICTSTGSLRLQAGTSYRNGRLEILTPDEEWGTVCNDGWDFREEYAACYQLGFHEGYDGSFTAPPGTGPIALGGVECGYVQVRLDSCPTNDTWTPQSCTHEQDVGIECISLVDFDSEGYVEEGIPTIYYAGQWGSICADNWNIDTARIFCRNARFEDALSASTTEEGEKMDILLNPKGCTGDESYYTECTDAEWAYQDGCNQPSLNPYVRCQLSPKIIDIVSPSGDDHFPVLSGRVVVIYGEETGASICDRTMTQEIAEVLCRDAGFLQGAIRFYTVGGGNGDEVFDNIRCTGDEERFDDCRSELVPASVECDHSHDVGVECRFGSDVPNSTEPIEPDITFLSGSGWYEGVVRYRVEDRNALICDSTWTDKEAAVACKMLLLEGGTTRVVVDLSTGDFGDVFQWDFECSGDEEDLKNCSVTKRDNSTPCSPENIAQVRCQPNSGGFRMTGNEHPEQGRLEYFTNDGWLAVWVDGDSATIPNIYSAICQAMGYELAIHSYRGANEMPFEQGSQGARFVIGEDLEIVILPSNSARDRNYQTGIVCKPFDIVAYHPVRLVDPDGNVSSGSGLVEIYSEGEWGSICQSREYYYPAEKVCSELGFEDAADAVHLDVGGNPSTAMFNVLPGPLNENCTTLYGCPHTAWSHVLDECIPFAVDCQPAPDNECRSEPCQNGGICFISDSDSTFTCQCLAGYDGDTCGNRGSSLKGLPMYLIAMVVTSTVNHLFIDV